MTDVATGESDEYVMGVVAKTGLTHDPSAGRTAPGYDYWIIFSRNHVFTKRSHSSAYLNNPTVLELKDFGEAKWHLRRVAAEPLQSAAEVRQALSDWQQLTAKTTFTSSDGGRQFSVEYPVKWADYTFNGNGFRIETGPVFLIDPSALRVGDVPKFADFQWAHFDYRTFDKVRCLLERPTSVLADATFTPPAEDGRQLRQSVALTQSQVDALRRAVSSEELTQVKPEIVDALLSTDHYSLAKEVDATTELYALGD